LFQDFVDARAGSASTIIIKKQIILPLLPRTRQTLKSKRDLIAKKKLEHKKKGSWPKGKRVLLKKKTHQKEKKNFQGSQGKKKKSARARANCGKVFCGEHGQKKKRLLSFLKQSRGGEVVDPLYKKQAMRDHHHLVHPTGRGKLRPNFELQRRSSRPKATVATHTHKNK